MRQSTREKLQGGNIQFTLDSWYFYHHKIFSHLVPLQADNATKQMEQTNLRN